MYYVSYVQTSEQHLFQTPKREHPKTELNIEGEQPPKRTWWGYAGLEKQKTGLINSILWVSDYKHHKTRTSQQRNKKLDIPLSRGAKTRQHIQDRKKDVASACSIAAVEPWS